MQTIRSDIILEAAAFIAAALAIFRRTKLSMRRIYLHVRLTGGQMLKHE